MGCAVGVDGGVVPSGTRGLGLVVIGGDVGMWAVEDDEEFAVGREMLPLWVCLGHVAQEGAGGTRVRVEEEGEVGGEGRNAVGAGDEGGKSYFAA